MEYLLALNREELAIDVIAIFWLWLTKTDSRIQAKRVHEYVVEEDGSQCCQNVDQGYVKDYGSTRVLVLEVIHRNDETVKWSIFILRMFKYPVCWSRFPRFSVLRTICLLYTSPSPRD